MTDRAERRRFIQPGSVTELRVLVELIERREVGDWPRSDSEEWQRILVLLERSIAMHVIGDAFTELVDDETNLFNPEERGYVGAAVELSLDRDNLGEISIGVRLNQIDGGQLSHVLEVARRHELEVREESGWLRLSPQSIVPEVETSDESEEALA